MKLVSQATTLALAILLATGAKAANPAPTTSEARAAELAAAQADLQRAARRVAELSREAGAEAHARERVFRKEAGPTVDLS